MSGRTSDGHKSSSLRYGTYIIASMPRLLQSLQPGYAISALYTDCLHLKISGIVWVGVCLLLRSSISTCLKGTMRAVQDRLSSMPPSMIIKQANLQKSRTSLFLTSISSVRCSSRSSFTQRTVHCFQSLHPRIASLSATPLRVLCASASSASS